MDKTIALDFQGYWREINQGGIPNNSGIYLVYRCVFNQSGQTVTLNKLIYIGESEEVKDRIENHEKKPIWQKKLQQGEQLCFSFAPITNSDRERAEAALIFKHKPECNEEYTTNFPFDTATINSSGRCDSIIASFTVNKTS
jgi:hypothetical protein